MGGRKRRMTEGKKIVWMSGDNQWWRCVLLEKATEEMASPQRARPRRDIINEWVQINKLGKKLQKIQMCACSSPTFKSVCSLSAWTIWAFDSASKCLCLEIPASIQTICIKNTDVQRSHGPTDTYAKQAEYGESFTVRNVSFGFGQNCSPSNSNKKRTRKDARRAHRSRVDKWQL